MTVSETVKADVTSSSTTIDSRNISKVSVCMTYLSMATIAVVVTSITMAQVAHSLASNEVTMVSTEAVYPT